MGDQEENSKDTAPRVRLYNNRNMLDVEGKDRIIAQQPELPTTPMAVAGRQLGHNPNITGATIRNAENVTYWQKNDYGDQIIVEGPNVNKSFILQGEGNDVLYMKDGAGITGNTFHGGLKDKGVGHSLGTAIDSITHFFGSHSLRTDNDTIVLEEKPEDYKFTFRSTANQPAGTVSSFDITHLASGATNHFVNYDYIVFGGRDKASDVTNYVEVAQIKAQQEAKAAVEKTGGKVTTTSDHTPQPVPGKGESCQR